MSYLLYGRIKSKSQRSAPAEPAGSWRAAVTAPAPAARTGRGRATQPVPAQFPERDVRRRDVGRWRSRQRENRRVPKFVNLFSCASISTVKYVTHENQTGRVPQSGLPAKSKRTRAVLYLLFIHRRPRSQRQNVVEEAGEGRKGTFTATHRNPHYDTKLGAIEMNHTDLTEEELAWVHGLRRGYMTHTRLMRRYLGPIPAEGFDSCFCEDTDEPNVVRQVSFNRADRDAAEKASDPMCKNCRFYRGHECHRFPPSAVHGRNTNAEWPRPTETEWCGCWEAQR